MVIWAWEKSLLQRISKQTFSWRWEEKAIRSYLKMIKEAGTNVMKFPGDLVGQSNSEESAILVYFRERSTIPWA